MTGLTLSALHEAYDYAGWGGTGEKTAYLCRRTGRVYFSGWDEDSDELPEDVDDPELYAVLPDKQELDLGEELALDFAAEEGHELRERVEGLFRSRGAYGRFMDLLEREGRLERWYEFEERCVKQALWEWCEDEGIALSEELQPVEDEQGSSSTGAADTESSS